MSRNMNPILLAPTTLMQAPPLEYIAAAADAGYDGIGLRLYPSPGMPFFPVLGDASLMADAKLALADSGLSVFDVFTCYLQPEMDFGAMQRAHEFGAELGARYALVIGDDEDWGRMVDHFGRLCDNAAGCGLICALEAPVNRRTLKTLDLNLKLIEESGRKAVLSIDPVQYTRAGHSFSRLKALDPALLPYSQICDSPSAEAAAPLCMPGEGIVPLDEMLDILSPDAPLSLEYHHRDERYGRAEWAKHVLDGTRAFLQAHYASRR
jgi:sugar phosphate isomerase/epimerase